jgi:ornithine--oxo-acid transaminase
MLERVQPGLFAQLVVVPLFAEHKILTQVAGHDSNVIKILPPLVLSESDVDWFVEALNATLGRAQKLPRAMVRFALKAARANRQGRRLAKSV